MTLRSSPGLGVAIDAHGPDRTSARARLSSRHSDSGQTGMMARKRRPEHWSTHHSSPTIDPPSSLRARADRALKTGCPGQCGRPPLARGRGMQSGSADLACATPREPSDAPSDLVAVAGGGPGQAAHRRQRVAACAVGAWPATAGQERRAGEREHRRRRAWPLPWLCVERCRAGRSRQPRRRGLWWRRVATADRDLEPPVRDGIEAVALLAPRWMSTSPPASPDRFHRTRQALEGRGGQRVEYPERAQ